MAASGSGGGSGAAVGVEDELSALLYGCGDALEPRRDTVATLRRLVSQYVAALVSLAETDREAAGGGGGGGGEVTDVNVLAVLRGPCGDAHQAGSAEVLVSAASTVAGLYAVDVLRLPSHAAISSAALSAAGAGPGAGVGAGVGAGAGPGAQANKARASTVVRAASRSSASNARAPPPSAHVCVHAAGDAELGGYGGPAGQRGVRHAAGP